MVLLVQNIYTYIFSVICIFYQGPFKHELNRMPTKKSQNKTAKRTSDKCKYYNRVYCNKKDDCANLHNDKVCEDLD
jgi:hypothetical protein